MKILITEGEGFSEEALSLLKDAGHDIHISRCATDALGFLREESDIEGLIVRFGIGWHASRLQALPALQFIACPATGTDHIDIRAAEQRGIRVLSLAGNPALRDITSTAELAFGLILALVRRIPAAHSDVMRGHWDRNSFRGAELKGKTLGIVGLGRLGKIVATMAQAFRMDVIYYDPYVVDSLLERVSTLTELSKRADIVSVHAVLNAETIGLIGEAFFGESRDGQLFVNTARGQIVDETALLQALVGGKLGGAAVDVLVDEPSTGEKCNLPLVEYARLHENLIVTPHIGGCTRDAMHATEIMICREIVGKYEGQESSSSV